MVKYLSLFSGVEAASVAWEPLGWEPMAFAEIEPFPSAVLAARFPDVPNLGDVTAVDWDAWKAQHGSPDVIVAGSPCQAFSVAGKRLSLEDARGNLSLFTAELVRFLNPRVFVWENVPGALSTKDNAFGCLLGDIVERMPPSSRQGSDGQVRVWSLAPKELPRGASSMLNTSEWPNDAAVSSLSRVLWAGPIPQKYYLSSKACAGILRRAERHGTKSEILSPLAEMCRLP